LLKKIVYKIIIALFSIIAILLIFKIIGIDLAPLVLALLGIN